MVDLRALTVVLLTVLLLSGCAQGGSEEPEVVYITQTVTQAPPAGPPTYFKLNVVFNQLDRAASLQAQAYSLDSGGQPAYTGTIRSLALTATERNSFDQAFDWVPCNERMEGIRIKVIENGDVVQDLQWAGYHCTGDAKQYALTIPPDLDLKLGAYTGSVQAPPRPPPPPPNIAFNKDSADRTLTVIQAEDAYWHDFTVTGCTLNAPASEQVEAGDQLVACSGTVSVEHEASGAVIYSTTFA